MSKGKDRSSKSTPLTAPITKSSDNVAPTPTPTSTPTPTAPAITPAPPSSSTPASTVLLTRLIIKNLPIHVNETRLRTLFTTCGDLTDVKIMKTPDGKSRKFGFVGYARESQAQQAIKKFHQSYIDTSKIVVELAVAKKAAAEPTPTTDTTTPTPALPRPWSKYSEGSSRHAALMKAKNGETEEKEEKKGKDKDQKKKEKQSGLFSKFLMLGLTPERAHELENDPKFREFMSVRMPTLKTKFWANDDGSQDQEILQMTQTYEDLRKREKSTIRDSDDESDDDDDAFANPELERVDEPTPVLIDDTNVKAIVNDNTLSDLEYLKRRATTVNDDEDADVKMETDEKEVDETEEKDGADEMDEDESDEDKTESKSSDAPPIHPESRANAILKQEEEAAAERQAALDTGRLFIRNLAYSVTEEDIQTLFGQYGNLAEIHIPQDANKKGKGFAYVLYTFPENAATALSALDGTVFQGRLLHILPSRPKPQSQTSHTLTLDEMDDDQKNALTYKKKKELMQKQAAAKQDNWNTLFLRSDTVISATASKYGVTKGEVLDRESDNMAVRQSLAEAQLINETKKFLAEQGVVLAAFDEPKSKVVRSKTVIIVKNIPFDTEADELKKLFTKFGKLGRLVMPPSKTMALVEYLDAGDAKKGFTGLAYKKFKHEPMYLEWAPHAVFAEPAKGPEVVKIKSDVTSAEEKDVEIGETATLFVKNLNFETTEESLRKLFETVAPVRAVTINQKKNPKAGAEPKMLSMGYGFVELKNKADAQRALNLLNKAKLDDHELELKVSTRASAASKKQSTLTSTSTSTSGDAPSTKLLVKNVPFETSKKELKELFGTYGQLKTLRLPKKFDGHHRGFAFVEFVTKQEAKNAVEALRHVHHYGRHLVLEWAKEEESLSELREKTIKRYQQTTGTVDRPAKRAKHATGDAFDDKAASFLDSLE